MTTIEKVKYLAKRAIPWRLRYHIKIWEAEGKIRIPNRLKTHGDVNEYNHTLYNILDELGIKDNLLNKTVCEIGPGEYCSHAALEYQMGADREILIDIKDFVGLENLAVPDHLRLDPKRYQIIRELPEISDNETWMSLLKKINGSYYTNGFEDYKQIQDNSVDICFGVSVLQHIRKKFFVSSIKEIYRFMRPGGVAWFYVDLRDMIGGKKNHLRFAADVWEDHTHYDMDNYTNRISYSEMCDIFLSAGFGIKTVKVAKFAKMPVSRRYLSEEFWDMTDKDLMISQFIIQLVKK